MESFRNHPLETEYPLIWIDALYERVRCEGRVMSIAIAVVQGLTLEGNREILAVEPMYAESEETYTRLFESLKRRGVEKVWLCVSDVHTGLEKSHSEVLFGGKLAALQSPLHEEPPCPYSLQRKRSLRCPGKADLATAQSRSGSVLCAWCHPRVR